MTEDGCIRANGGMIKAVKDITNIPIRRLNFPKKKFVKSSHHFEEHLLQYTDGNIPPNLSEIMPPTI